MRLRGPLAAALVALALLLLPAPAPADAAKQPVTVTLSGTAVTQALVADLAYFYRHAVPDPPRFSLLGGGANTGVADAARGVVDAGMLARDLGPDDPSELVFTPLALSALCMITNPSNPVPDFTRALIQQIFTGQVTSWSQVPGSERTDAIVPAGVILSSAASVYWASVFLDAGTRITYTPRRFTSTAQTRDFVAATPAAWSYTDLIETRGVHAASYQGVACARSGVRDGTYLPRRPLGLVTRGKPRGEVKRFLGWIATSAKARQVIATRYIPL
jgi:phosphate transport system substrate-binding protein